MPCFIWADSGRVDMSARGRHADEAFISPAANEPFCAHATPKKKKKHTTQKKNDEACGRRVHDLVFAGR